MTTRILHIIPTLDHYGTAKQLCLLAAGLARDEFDVHVCELGHRGSRAGDLASRGIPTTAVGRSWQIDPAAQWRLARHVRRLAPDVVHTWTFQANTYGRLAAARASVPHLVASERSVDRWKLWHHRAIDRCLARHTRRIVVNSESVRDFCTARGLSADRLCVIPNGVEVSEKAPATSRAELLDELNLPRDAELIGVIGPLTLGKRIKDLIWAACLLKEVRRNSHLLILGEGPHRWRLGRYRSQVEFRQRHVHFLGERRDVPRILPHLCSVWLGGSHEGQSNALMEAMAAGVPVVAADVPGNRELIARGESGYLVRVGDSAAFARWTDQVLGESELARRVGEAGRRRMRECFPVQRMVRRYADLYREIIG